ncbi:glucosyltransferase [Ascosphaera pollenicola]|nr:glucosyltransferase [Ascosphaera pollenicola]
MSAGHRSRKGAVLLPFTLTAVLAATLSIFWRQKIDSILPGPYLDEVFHVRQAQAYWQGHWRQWDPKITTPPGLYVLSIGILILASHVLPSTIDGSTSNFRATNGLVVFNALQLRLRRLLGHIRTEYRPSELCAWELNWTALNICLFPPIFFFSGLYYTDLAALLFVLEAYWQDLKNGSTTTAWGSLKLIAGGLISLCFRQTNIIWIVGFIGGLKALRVLHASTTACRSSETSRVVKGSWRLQQLYDPSARSASISDYLKSTVSIGLNGLLSIPSIIKAVIPHLIVLIAFGAFVLWNGSIVLGHKEFHTVQVHLPQMLYIWPYFMFFSWPLFVIPFSARLYEAAKTRRIHSICKTLPGVLVSGVFIVAMVMIVHFNTIVHPFTLADNRHYVFYVFRISLRHPTIKYLVTPLYFVCAWASLSTLSGTWTRYSIAEAEESSCKAKPVPRTSEGDITVSFVLVWLAATTLTLVTAPLVEPRYFIIPWVIWRLRVPPPPIDDGALQARILRNIPYLLEKDLNGRRSQELFNGLCGSLDDIVEPASDLSVPKCMIQRLEGSFLEFLMNMATDFCIEEAFLADKI